MVDKNKQHQNQKKTWFVYDAHGPLFSWSPTGNRRESYARIEEYIKKSHGPDIYRKAMVENDRASYLEITKMLQKATLSGELPPYPNKRIIKLAHKIKEFKGTNTIITDADKNFLVELIYRVSEGNSPFDEKNIKDTSNVGSKKDSKTWYSIFQKMGVNRGDRFYGVEDTEDNARAMAEAAKKSGLVARVFLLDDSLSSGEARKDGDIIRIGGEEYLERKIHNHLRYHTKKSSNASKVVVVFLLLFLGFF